MESKTKQVFSRSRFSRRDILSMGTAGMLAVGVAPQLAIAASVPSQRRIDTALSALDKDKLVKLAMDLTNIPSPLGHEEEIARFLHECMQHQGLITRLQPFAPGRSNVLGIHEGSGGGRILMLNGHLETGGSKEGGSFPTARLVDGEWISGRGIWNMKGSLAAYLAAVIAIRKADIDLSGDVLIAGVAGAWDEAPVDSRIKGEAYQGYGVGTKYLLAHGGVADLCVVGEPTSFKLVKQHFGKTMVRIDVLLRTSIPDTVDDLTGSIFVQPPGSNAVEQAAEIVQALRAWIPDYQRRNTVASVAPPVDIAAIESGLPWSPAAPTKSSIFIGVGTPPHAPLTAVLDEIRQVLAKVREMHPGLEAHAELYATNPGPFVPDDSPIVTALRAAHADIFGHDPNVAVVQWYSDASPLNQYGIPTVNYGPAGKFSPAGEFIRISDLVSCARVYIDLIVRVCGDPTR